MPKGQNLRKLRENAVTNLVAFLGLVRPCVSPIAGQHVRTGAETNLMRGQRTPSGKQGQDTVIPTNNPALPREVAADCRSYVDNVEKKKRVPQGSFPAST